MADFSNLGGEMAQLFDIQIEYPNLFWIGEFGREFGQGLFPQVDRVKLHKWVYPVLI